MNLHSQGLAILQRFTGIGVVERPNARQSCNF